MSKSKKKTERIFENLNQVYRYLQDESGFQVSYNTVKNAYQKKPRRLSGRRGGGFSQTAVDSYAQKYLMPKIDPSASADAPPVAEVTGDLAADDKRESARLKRIRAEKEEFQFARERGKYMETSVFEAELGKRAKAFKLGLDDFPQKHGERVAATFGADKDLAAELLRELDCPTDKIPIVIDFILSRVPDYRRFWLTVVEDFLAPYATGHFFTEEMAKKWEKYEEYTHDNSTPTN
ncbi:MAG: hypothetical protein CL942_05765 [Desulfovibrio sp.]|nr:hypothetical protein [Desulfovibrio sp.]|tara:strand:- start:529 stop:1233 length:705 start_codon:yes stop_codon:yes gene_type:complete